MHAQRLIGAGREITVGQRSATTGALSAGAHHLRVLATRWTRARWAPARVLTITGVTSFTGPMIMVETPVMHTDAIEGSLAAMRADPSGELAGVGEAMRIVEHADHLLVQMVARARAAGRSWEQVAAALDTGAQRAHQRWQAQEQAAHDRDRDRASIPG